MGTLLTDFLHGLRALRRTPGHVLAAVVSLAVGITASTSVFSIVNALFYRQVPGVSDRIHVRRASFVPADPRAMPSPASTDEVRALQRAGTSAVELATEGDTNVAVTGGSGATRAVASFVTGNYFRVLGTTASLGRLIGDADDRAGADPVVVVSDLYWRRQLGARPGVAGESITIGGRPFTIVGVAPTGFGGLELSELGEPAGSRVQFWLPLAAAAGWRGVPSRGTPWHSMVVRLGPGVTEQIAAVQLTSAAAGITRGAPAATVRVALSPLGAGPGDVPTDIAIMIALFLAVPMSVLAIGCANVANLQLARATARARDAAIRLALGGSRSAVTRLLATEAAILAIIAGFAGTAGTLVVTRLAVSVLPLSLSVDWRVLAFTIALVGLAILLAGVLPAWLATRRATTVGLHQASQAAAVGHARLRQALVAFQVALSLALLVVGALFARSLGAHYAGAPRATSELVVAAVDLDMAGYDGAAARRFLDDVTGRLRADPRIRAAGVHSLRALRYRSVDAQPGADRYGIGRYVTPAWFEAMDVEPLSGRLFTADDGRAAAVVNQRLADRLAPGRPVVGTVIEVRESEGDVPRLVRITGVIPNAPPPPDPQDDPAIYLPMPIEPLLSLTVVVRTAMPAILLRDVARLFSDIDPRLPLIDLSTGEALFARALSPVRYLVLAAGGLGTLALVLAAAGLYAMLSYVVQLRRREIAVRMALGAQPSDVVALVLGQSLRLTLAGLTAGLAIVVPLAFVVRFLFVGVSPIDPAAIGVPAGVLLVAALVAAAAPAAHAAGVDPARVLRRE